ncbi:hypothetical protein AYI68_g7096, partial [Smittium mucronatum]
PLVAESVGQRDSGSPPVNRLVSPGLPEVNNSVADDYINQLCIYNCGNGSPTSPDRDDDQGSGVGLFGSSSQHDHLPAYDQSGASSIDLHLDQTQPDSAASIDHTRHGSAEPSATRFAGNGSLYQTSTPESRLDNVANLPVSSDTSRTEPDKGDESCQFFSLKDHIDMDSKLFL